MGEVLEKLLGLWSGTARASESLGAVLGGCRIRKTWIGGMLDGLIDLSRSGLNSYQRKAVRQPALFVPSALEDPSRLYCSYMFVFMRISTYSTY